MMKKLIKVTALALSAALFTLPLASCGGSGDKDLPTIGIIQFAVHSSLDNCYEGLIKGLEKAGYKDGETCTIDLKNAQGDPTTADSIAGTMANKNVDMIIGIATPAAVSAYNAAGGDIPAIFCAVNDPVAVKLVQSLEKSGNNCAGSSDRLNLEGQLKMIRAFQPDAAKARLGEKRMGQRAALYLRALQRGIVKIGIGQLAVRQAGIAPEGMARVQPDGLALFQAAAAKVGVHGLRAGKVAG